eukprot:CAMPEP_0117421212 /NCGR_PEP_ID=MMETSP0758-20121206/2372_1 /TAXON_ID=63605 /ORGANISM="Percolomonas cosmopolitus, Strain AE-1 (ATCC 50343)" /LENGTH=190 /DNA_ID=CAMNT_0005203247 /DNA_START=1004 /DNA_END=1573 /DNA_ORIENTATION=-
MSIYENQRYLMALNAFDILENNQTAFQLYISSHIELVNVILIYHPINLDFVQQHFFEVLHNNNLNMMIKMKEIFILLSLFNAIWTFLVDSWNSELLANLIVEFIDFSTFLIQQANIKLQLFDDVLEETHFAIANFIKHPSKDIQQSEVIADRFCFQVIHLLSGPPYPFRLKLHALTSFYVFVINSPVTTW